MTRGPGSRVETTSHLIWAFSFVVFEFLGPFNLLGEPLALVAVELVFWAIAATFEAFVIVVLLTPRGESATAPGGRPPVNA